MSEQYVCWKCGKSIEDHPMPLGRNAECSNCGSDLHVCKLCVFYNINVNNQCSEPIADYVQEKSRANFCGYFAAKADAYVVQNDTAVSEAKKELESLFGLESDILDSSDNPDLARQELEKLFGMDDKEEKDKK